MPRSRAGAACPARALWAAWGCPRARWALPGQCLRARWACLGVPARTRVSVRLRWALPTGVGGCLCARGGCFLRALGGACTQAGGRLRPSWALPRGCLHAHWALLGGCLRARRAVPGGLINRCHSCVMFIMKFISICND